MSEADRLAQFGAPANRLTTDAEQARIGPWEVIADKAHNGTPFWKLKRRNPAFKGYHFGYETLATPKGAIRRFYDPAKAHAEADKRNAASGVRVEGGTSNE